MYKGPDLFITAKGEYLEKEELIKRFDLLEAKELGKTVEEVRKEFKAKEKTSNRKVTNKRNSFIETADYAEFIYKSLEETMNKEK